MKKYQQKPRWAIAKTNRKKAKHQKKKKVAPGNTVHIRCSR